MFKLFNFVSLFLALYLGFQLRLNGYSVLASFLTILFAWITNFTFIMISYILIIAHFDTPLSFQRPLYNKWKYTTLCEISEKFTAADDKMRDFINNEIDAEFEKLGIEAVLIAEQNYKKWKEEHENYKASFTQ